MRKDEYIATAVSKITNKKAKRETEKELAAHIDELIEFYLDRSGSKEEAEEKAVADMGEAQSISQKLGKLHTGAGFYLFFTIIGFISACFVYVIAFKGSVFEIVSLLFDPPGLIESAVIAVFGENAVSLLGDVFDLTIILVIFFCILFGYFKKKIFLIIASGIELYLFFQAILYSVLDEFTPVCLAVALTLFVLTLILINITDKERIMLGEESEYFGVPTRIIASFGIAFLIFCVVCLAEGFFMVDFTKDDMETAKQAQIVFDEYLTQMPNEAVDADTVGNMDFENYEPIRFKSQWEKGWRVDGKYLKPDKLISKTVKGDYYKDLKAYWTSNYNDNYLFYAELSDPYTVDGEWLMKKSIELPKFYDDEVSCIEVFGVRFQNLFDKEELQTVKYLSEQIDANHRYYIDGYKAHISIKWSCDSFKELYKIYGYFVITQDGKCYISPQVLPTEQIEDWTGESGFVSYGLMYELDESKAKEIISQLPNDFEQFYSEEYKNYLYNRDIPYGYSDWDYFWQDVD